MHKTKGKQEKLIVITGAAGFIGSGVVRHLNDLGFSSLLLVDDLKQSEKWKNLVGKRFTDIISRYTLFPFLQENAKFIDSIIHLGACSDTTCMDVDYLLENNYRYSVKLAEFALKNKLPFIYASSAATYGDGSRGFLDDEALLPDLKPLNPYGYSKQLFDLWLLKEKALDQVVGLKYFNIFGPNEYHKKAMASWIFKVAKKAKTEKRVELFRSNDPDIRDGEQKRDFLYVKDAAKMTCLFLEKDFQKAHGIFNIGSGIPTSWNDLAAFVFKALGLPPKIEYIDMPATLAGQYQNYTCADMKKFFSLPAGKKNLFSLPPLDSRVKEYVKDYILKDERW